LSLLISKFEKKREIARWKLLNWKFARIRVYMRRYNSLIEYGTHNMAFARQAGGRAPRARQRALRRAEQRDMLRRISVSE